MSNAALHIEALNQGQKVRRASWPAGTFIYRGIYQWSSGPKEHVFCQRPDEDSPGFLELDGEDLIAGDWEIVP